MYFICFYRVHEDLREMKKKSDILRASCRNYEDCRLEADVQCYPETSGNCWKTLRSRMLESNIRQRRILF